MTTVRRNLTSRNKEDPVPTPQLLFLHFRLMQMLSNPHSQQQRLHILTITLHPTWHAASRPLQAKRLNIQHDNTASDNDNNNNAWHNERHVPRARRRQQDSWHCDKYRFKELLLLPCLWSEITALCHHQYYLNWDLWQRYRVFNKKINYRFTVAMPEIRGFRKGASYVTSCTWLGCVIEASSNGEHYRQVILNTPGIHCSKTTNSYIHSSS